QEAQVRPRSESGKQLLLENDLHVGIKLGIQRIVWAIRCLAVVVEISFKVGPGWKGLLIADIGKVFVQMIARHAQNRLVRQLLSGVVVVDLGHDKGIEAGNIASDAEGGLHKTAT